MNISVSRLNLVIHDMDHVDIKIICKKYLGIDPESLTIRRDQHRIFFEYGTKRPVVIIEAPADIYSINRSISLEIRPSRHKRHEIGQKIDLELNLQGLNRYLLRRNHSIQRLDIAFIDNDHALSSEDIRQWCSNSHDYCVGSFVQRHVPILKEKEGMLRSVRLGDKLSLTNCGVIRVTDDNSSIQFELTIRKSDKIEYLMDALLLGMDQLNERCKELLVSCIDFVTPTSKKTRVKARYVRLEPWALFLGSTVNTINWSRIRAQLGKRDMRVPDNRVDKIVDSTAAI